MTDLQRRRVEIIAELSEAMRNGWIYEDYAPLQRELRELERQEREGRRIERQQPRRQPHHGATDPERGDWA
jgi:hypothetical protein